MANQPGSVIHVTRCHTFFWPTGSTVFGGEVWPFPIMSQSAFWSSWPCGPWRIGFRATNY